MKLKIVLTCLIITLMISVTGCTSTNSNKVQEQNNGKEVTIMYCSECASGSDELSKYCPECGVEAKWVTEKPKVDESNTEDKKDNNSEDDKSQKSNVDDKNKEVKCTHCATYYPERELTPFNGGLLCPECYNLPKTCSNGFADICDGCEDCIPSAYNPSDYDLYYPEVDTSSIYTCVNCGRTTNMPLGNIGLCEKCSE